MIPQAITSQFMEETVPLTSAFDILVREFKTFSSLSKKYEDQMGHQTFLLSRLKSENDHNEDAQVKLKEVNEAVQEDLRKERELNEKILERIDKIEDEELKRELLEDVENLRLETETSTLPETEMQKRLTEEYGILNDEEAIKSVSHVYFNRPPPSRETLHNYLKKFVERDAWIFEEKSDFEEFQKSIDAYESLLQQGDEEEDEATRIQPVMDPQSLTQLEWCQECNDIYSIDTYPVEEKDPSLISFYIDTPDLVREGRMHDLPKKPYLSELTILKRELKKKRRKLSDLVTKMRSLEETRHFFRKQFMYFAHLDSVRKICFHPAEPAPLLFSCSDDSTIKMWSTKRVHLVGDRTNLHDCLYTFRGHIGPVYDLVAHPEDFLFSGGHDGTVRFWKVPNERETWERSTKLGQLGMFEMGCFKGHRDIVWSIAQTKTLPVLSCSSDGTIRAWDWRSVLDNDNDEEEEDGEVNNLFKKNVGMLFKYECKEGRIPTVIRYRPFRNEHVIVGYTDGFVGLYDIQKQTLIGGIQDQPIEGGGGGGGGGGESTIPENVNPLLIYDLIGLGSDGSNDSGSFRNMVISGHEDGVLRVYDIENQKIILGSSSFPKLMRHKGAVSGISESPFSPSVASVSHDCSIRQWDLKKFSVVQDFSEGRNKGDEGIHCVQYHPNLDWIMATGSSDAIIKLMYSNLAPDMDQEEKEAHDAYQKQERRRERKERKRKERSRRKRERKKKKKTAY